MKDLTIRGLFGSVGGMQVEQTPEGIVLVMAGDPEIGDYWKMSMSRDQATELLLQLDSVLHSLSLAKSRRPAAEPMAAPEQNKYV